MAFFKHFYMEVPIPLIPNHGFLLVFIEVRCYLRIYSKKLSAVQYCSSLLYLDEFRKRETGEGANSNFKQLLSKRKKNRE
jgi:hypothetical protein